MNSKRARLIGFTSHRELSSRNSAAFQALKFTFMRLNDVRLRESPDMYSCFLFLKYIRNSVDFGIFLVFRKFLNRLFF